MPIISLSKYLFLENDIGLDNSENELEDKNLSGIQKSFLTKIKIKDLLLNSSNIRGEKFFNKCASCHTIKKNDINKMGPNLWNIMFKNIASTKDYSYSKAFIGIKYKKWGFELLNKFLRSPFKFIKGTNMNFSGIINPKDRMDLLNYLNMQSDKPYLINKFKFKN